MSARPLAASLALGLLALFPFACGGTPTTPKATETAIALPATVDLAPAAGLSTLVEVHPKALLAHAELLPVLDVLYPDDSFRTFATRHGGVDPRQLDDIVVATYPRATLVLARGVLDPAKEEASFGRRAMSVDARFVDHRGGPLSTVIRLRGTMTDGREELVLFGHQAAALDLLPAPKDPSAPWAAGPVRAAELFALHRLKKARPVLRTPPLQSASALLGPAPVRIFFAGPFEGDAQEGLAGLLKAATAVGIAVRPAGDDREHASDEPGAALDVTVTLLGAWGNDAKTAGDCFAAALNTIAHSGLGRLSGVDRPRRGPDLHTSPEALTVTLTVDALELVRGVRAATSAQIQEIMSY